MKLNKIIAELKKLQREGHGSLEVEIYAHYQDINDERQGDGVVCSVDHITQYSGKEIIIVKS